MSDHDLRLASGSFEVRCVCPNHPIALMRRFGDRARCPECGRAVNLCGAVFGTKECVLPRGHDMQWGHVSPSGSAWPDGEDPRDARIRELERELAEARVSYKNKAERFRQGSMVVAEILHGSGRVTSEECVQEFSDGRRLTVYLRVDGEKLYGLADPIQPPDDPSLDANRWVLWTYMLHSLVVKAAKQIKADAERRERNPLVETPSIARGDGGT